MSADTCGCDGPHLCPDHRPREVRCEAGHIARFDWCAACRALRAEPLRRREGDRATGENDD